MPRWSTAQAVKVDAGETIDPAEPGREQKPGPERPPLKAADALPVDVDPYLRWALSTNWSGFARASGWPDPRESGDRKVRLIVKAKTAAAMVKALGDDTLLHVPPSYRDDVPAVGETTPATYFTATVRDAHIARLAVVHADLEWELATPVRDPSSAARGSAHGYFGPTRDVQAFTPPNCFKDITPKEVGAGSITGNVIAVIDFGCPFLHDHFCRGDDSRVAALWDQSANPGNLPDKPGKPGKVEPPRGWCTPSAFGHGRELGQAQMSAMRKQLRAPGADFSETQAYAGINYLIAYDDPRRRVHFATHGAHVLDMAGGNVDPLTDKRDKASQAKLVFVQLPALTAVDSSGGSLSAHLLDAVRYVLHVCSNDAKVVVNISYGSFAGAHDGQSMIEAALDELLEARGENFAIVLGAGNARRAACHVKRAVAHQRSAMLRMNLIEGDTTDTFVEVWYAPPAEGACLSARVRRAGDKWSPWVNSGELSKLMDLAGSEVVGQLIHGVKRDRHQRAMILLALRPTATPINDDGPLASPGLWEIEIKREGDVADSAPTELQAWIQRDDPSDYSGRTQSCFVGLEPGDANDCLSSIATGQHTVVVGGFRISDQRMTSYSSVGPRRDDQLPLVLAACERDETERGINAAAVRSAEVLKMNGTSVAAPVLARRLLNVMAEGKVIAKGKVIADGKPVGRADWRMRLEALAEADPFVKWPAK